MTVSSAIATRTRQARAHPLEQDRLDSLLSYGVLDTPAEAGYDAVAALAAQVCQTPLAAVTLLDGDRQWFKSMHGLALAETPRDVSFCSEVVADGLPVVVEDARSDPRFRDSPLVTGDPHIRGYLGVPPIGRDGLPLGALCALDQQARRFSVGQVATMTALAQHVMTLLEQGRRDRADGLLADHMLPDARDPVRLRQALERGELVPFFQPLVDIGTGRPHQLEALLRWEHPQLGPLPPVAFLPALESTALIVPLGRAVLHHACAQLVRLREQQITLAGGVAVNVAGGQLARPGLARDVLAALALHQLPGDQLTLEITEANPLPDDDLARAELAVLVAHDVHVVVDDYGVGWGNLSRILDLPVDGLKIDQSIAVNVLTDQRAAVMVAATTAMASTMDLTVTAEGVESVEVRDPPRPCGLPAGAGAAVQHGRARRRRRRRPPPAGRTRPRDLPAPPCRSFPPDQRPATVTRWRGAVGAVRRPRPRRQSCRGSARASRHS